MACSLLLIAQCQPVLAERRAPTPKKSCAPLARLLQLIDALGRAEANPARVRELVAAGGFRHVTLRLGGGPDAPDAQRG